MYEINVTLNGQHYFATDVRSAPSLEDAQRLGRVLTDRFPVSEGFRVTACYRPQTSYPVDLTPAR